MNGYRLARRYSIEVPCTIDLQASATSVHAHVELEGVDVSPGDSVLVHDAPVRMQGEERVVCRRYATVRRASSLRRAWTRLAGHFELGELCEVGFTARRTR